MLAPQNNMPNIPQDIWYVQVNGQAYGPYSEAQMQGFVTEGRVNAQSIISQNAAEGYANAAHFKSFQTWSGQQPQMQQPPALQAQSPNPQTPTPQTPSPQAQVLRPISATGGGVLARQIQPVGHATQATVPNPRLQPQHSQPQTQYQPRPQAQATATTVFMVMAEIRSANGMQFLQTLQTQGTAQRIGDAVWLLRSGASVEQLRNVLSQSLTGEDRLFLLDSFANKTAWFNIGSDMDKRVRELWDINP